MIKVKHLRIAMVTLLISYTISISRAADTIESKAANFTSTDMSADNATGAWHMGNKFELLGAAGLVLVIILVIIALRRRKSRKAAVKI